jgi:hypothetical protein
MNTGTKEELIEEVAAINAEIKERQSDIDKLVDARLTVMRMLEAIVIQEQEVVHRKGHK